MVAVGAAAAVVAGLLAVPAMGSESPEPDPALMTDAATGAEQPEARSVPEPPPGITTQAWSGAGSAARTGDFVLRNGAEGLGKKVAGLDAALPKQGVQKILAHANRELGTGGGCTADPFGTGDHGKPLAPTRKYCLAGDDATSKEWVPQAVTGVSDAQADESWGTSRPVLLGSNDDSDPGRTRMGCPAKASRPADG